MFRVQLSANRLISFLQTEVWRLSKSELSGTRAHLLRPLRIALLTIHGCVRDGCALRASALTFYSLLATVPVLAVGFGLAKGFGLEQRLESELYMRLPGQGEMVARIIVFARSLLEQTKGGLVAGIGIAVLLWSSLKVMNHIEDALNTIWKVRSRTVIRKFTDYLAIMVVGPLLLIVSSSMTVYITSEIETFASRLALLRLASPVIYFVLKLFPFGIIWLLFILIYMVIPNRSVPFRSALTAGLIAGTVYQIVQAIYIDTQVLISKESAIYGSFAALPFFIVWLQSSWLIVLFGAEIAFAHQHVSSYAMLIDLRKTSFHFRKLQAIRMLQLIIREFENGGPPPTADDIAEQLKLPFPLVDHLIQRLVDCGLVAMLAPPAGGGSGFQPARSPHAITIAAALEALDRLGQNQLASEPPEDDVRIRAAVETLLESLHDSPANRLVRDIIV